MCAFSNAEDVKCKLFVKSPDISRDNLYGSFTGNCTHSSSCFHGGRSEQMSTGKMTLMRFQYACCHEGMKQNSRAMKQFALLRLLCLADPMTDVSDTACR